MNIFKLILAWTFWDSHHHYHQPIAAYYSIQAFPNVCYLSRFHCSSIHMTGNCLDWCGYLAHHYDACHMLLLSRIYRSWSRELFVFFNCSKCDVPWSRGETRWSAWHVCGQYRFSAPNFVDKGRFLAKWDAPQRILWADIASLSLDILLWV